MVPTDVLRVLIGTSVLAFAALTDLRWRRAPDACWWIIGLAGLGLLAIDLYQIPDLLTTQAPAFAVAGLLLVASVAGYWFGLIGGGADAKAMISLALLAPLPLDATWSLPMHGPFPLVLTLLVNALMVALLVPVGLAVINLARGDLSGWHTFLGLRVPIERLDTRVLWPLEFVDEHGQVVRVLTPRSLPLEALEPEHLARHGIEEAWATPKIPFLVPLLIGLAIAVLIGDPVAVLLERLLG